MWFKRFRLDDEDLQEEIRAHLHIAAADRRADGADARDAELAALKDFGNVTLTREAVRRVWTPSWLEALLDLWSDARYAVRALAKNPVFSLAVIAVLTLGIGLNATVFTMLKSLAISPLAGVQNSARLGVVFLEAGTGHDDAVSYPDYQYLRDHDRAFNGLLGTIVASPSLGRGRTARQIFAEIVSGNYFQVLGVRAALGRTLLPSDEIAPSRHPVVVISDGLWRRDFNADPAIVGKTIEINNHLLTVVGVADPTFHGTIVSYDVEAFVPVMMAPELGYRFGSAQTTPSGVLADRHTGVFYVHGRLRPQSTLASAAAEMDTYWATLSRDRPLGDAAQHLRVVPFWRSPNGAQTYLLPTLILLTVMGLLVLSIACANIAGLVLVRGLSRRGEIAVRLALGATRTRIVRLLIVENLILALPGAFFGVLLALRAIPILVEAAERLAMPQRLFFNVEVDSLLIGFAAFVACGSALAFGFVPALRSSRVDLVSVINEDASPRGASRGRMRAALVVAQVAVSLLLLVGAGLAARSLDAARRAYPGFDRDHTTSMTLDVKLNGYDEARGRVFYRHLLDELRRAPGVESATLAMYSPLTLVESRSQRLTIDGYEPRKGEDVAFLNNAVGPDYFRTLGIPVLAGRDFQLRDDEEGAPVAIVNATLAQRFWGGAANALGRRVRAGDGDWRTVVGVASDVKYLTINEAPRPYFYLPFLQAYRSNMIVHTRGSAPVDVLVDRARATVAALDPDLPILSARPLRASTRGALIFLELTSTMLMIFGTAGMTLAAMGTYGLVSYLVKQSTHEIGIRMALGASGRSVVMAFLGRGLRLGAVGAALGCLAALGVGRLLGSALYGVTATDGISFARALTIVLVVVAIATVVPAWRASRTDPLGALRHP
jgi:macrolide transport system ATP-binding/permease protein